MLNESTQSCPRPSVINMVWPTNVAIHTITKSGHLVFFTGERRQKMHKARENVMEMLRRQSK